MATNYPPVSFSFTVHFLNVKGMGESKEQEFLEVSGIGFSLETKLPSFDKIIPTISASTKRIEYPNLILKRVFMPQSALAKWLDDAVNEFGSKYPINFRPSDITITLLGPDYVPVASWKVVQATPVKWSISEFNAMTNNLAVETIELSYKKLIRHV